MGKELSSKELKDESTSVDARVLHAFSAVNGLQIGEEAASACVKWFRDEYDLEKDGDLKNVLENLDPEFRYCGDN